MRSEVQMKHISQVRPCQYHAFSRLDLKDGIYLSAVPDPYTEDNYGQAAYDLLIHESRTYQMLNGQPETRETRGEEAEEGHHSFLALIPQTGENSVWPGLSLAQHK